MANTRTAAKRAKQAIRRRDRNRTVRSEAKTVLKQALTAIQQKDVAKAKAAYESAVKSLSSAASKGGMPKTRAARKISRLTKLAIKVLPDALNFQLQKKKAAKATKSAKA